jgi:hypothetical protein
MHREHEPCHASLTETATTLRSTLHYNIKWVGGVLLNRVSARYSMELRPDVIEWEYCVAEKRELTKKEIAKLCAGR